MTNEGPDFAAIYAHELDRLADEIRAYENEADLWTTIGAQKNSPGTLALHTVGALMAKIGAELGGTGYVRDRDREFSDRDVPRDEILRRILECRDTIVPLLQGLDDHALGGPYPGQRPAWLENPSVRLFLMHLLWHLGWHLGHIYYHRLGIGEES